MSKRRPSSMWLLVTLALAACESDSKPEPEGPLPPGNACQGSPGELSRPPAGSLPCELIPPGLDLGQTE